MIFIGIGLGALLTIGVSFIFAADRNVLDEGDNKYYDDKLLINKSIKSKK
jgi:hypothetical protein